MNINKTITTGLCIMVAGSFAFAEGEMSVFREGEGVIPESEELNSNVSSWGSFSFRAGYFGVKEDDNLFDYGVGGQMEFRVGLGKTPIDLVLRGHYAYAEYKDYYAYLGNGRYYFENEEHSQYGGSAQLQFNFNRDGEINPYVAVGGMYDKVEMEADYWGYDTYARTYHVGWWTYRSTYHQYHSGRIEIDDDGSGFVGRLGVELNLHPLYARVEGAFVSKVHDDAWWFEEKNQAEINAIVGAHITDSVRLDFSGTYFTKWEEYFILGGATFLF